FSEDGIVEYYLPDVGVWTNLITGEKRNGGKWYKEKFDYFSLPLMVKPGSIIPIGNNKERPDYDYADNVTLYIFEPIEGKESICEVYSLKKEVELKIKLLKENNKTKINIEKDLGKPYSIILFDNFKVQKVIGGEIEKTEKGIKIIPNKGVKEIIIEE
ncbi:MAG: hypothetical protein QXY96_07045, partial [Candidatus Methanomethylicaceae archaeon]